MLDSLQYLTITQCDLKLGISELGRIATKPTDELVALAKRMVTYAVQNKEVPVVFTAKNWVNLDGMKFSPM